MPVCMYATIYLQKEVLMMTEKHHIAFRRSILAALLSVSTFFLPGCTASRPSGSANAPASGTGSSSKALEFKNVSSVSIASVLKDRNRDANEELLAGFDWFYDGYMKSGQSLEYMPKGAVSVTDPSRLDGEWMATHYRHPNDSWQKQILIADIQTEGDAVSYTETWQYIFFHDGSQQDARTAAHNLPYTGKAGRNPLTVSLTEAYFDNKLDYLNVYEYNGFLYAVGTYYSDYDKDSGFAAMYKAVDDFTPSAKPQPVTTEKPAEIKPSGSREEQADPNEVPETVPAPNGLEYLEETWKGGDYYFTIRFLKDGRLNYTQYSVEPLAEDTGFGGMDAHYVTNSYCSYTSGSAAGSVSFSDPENPKVSLVIERISDDSLKIQTYTDGKRSGESTVSRADSPTVFVPLKK